MGGDCDAVVIGAGAAGLMAGIHAAERGRRVLVVEKGRKPGVKILMSGGTRCELKLRNVSSGGYTHGRVAPLARGVGPSENRIFLHQME